MSRGNPKIIYVDPKWLDSIEWRKDSDWKHDWDEQDHVGWELSDETEKDARRLGIY